MNIVISDTTALIILAKSDSLALSLKQVSDLKILEKIGSLNIDDGEIEAISLAMELDLKLVIDEKKGRKIAMSQGVKIIGVLGILIENYRQDFISLQESHLCYNLFKTNGLRVSETLEKLFFEKLDELKI